MTVHLDLEDLLLLVEDLGVGPVRDVGLLGSAAHRPTTTLWGDEAHQLVVDMAAGRCATERTAGRLRAWADSSPRVAR